jgi:hypothetical protein
MRGANNLRRSGVVTGLCAGLAASVCWLGTTGAMAAELPVKARGPVPMAVGGWMFSPTLFAGAVYNSNINQTPDRIASWGERVVPGFTATLDNGIHQTSLYGLADFQNYHASGAAHRTTIDAKAGITQTYLARRDLTVTVNADYTRQSDVFGASSFAQPNTPLSPTSGAPVAPMPVSPQVNPTRFNQYSGSVAIEKRFGRTFVGLTTSVIATQFDSDPVFTTSRNGVVYTVAQRTGFDLTPQIYVFIDPSVNWLRYSDSSRDSNGYRISGGLGTAAPGIWQGEIFAGYQAQKNDIVGTYDSAVYGVRIGYSPTRFWNIRASLDETLGASTIAAGGTTGSATRTTTALVNVGYNGLPPAWTAMARGGFIRTDFINAPRTDDGWMAGANVAYAIWRNLGVALDYQYKSVTSNAAGQSFNQHVVSLGATYKY